jgi:polygalacturonase
VRLFPQFNRREVPFISGLAILAGFVVMGSTGAATPTNAPVNHSASSFSNLYCSARGATNVRVFQPDDAEANTGADSTYAIQEAINTASSSGGGIVSLPAGIFTIDGHLIMRSNVKLTGVGQGTILRAGPDFLDTTGPQGGYPLITTSGASNVTIANLTADQSGETINATSVFRFAAYLVDVRNSYNAVVDDVYTRNPFTYSIAVVNSSDFCIVHCNTRVATSGLYNGLDGIHILDSNTGQVIGNYVDQRIGTDGDDGLVAHTINGSTYDVLYADNIVRGGNDGDGMQLAVGDYPIYNITIRNNNFWGSPFGIRTGYWDTGANGAVTTITIDDNYIHDLVPGEAFPDGGDAINMGGFGAVAPVTYVRVFDNRICDAGGITVVSGIGNVATGNQTCSA